MPRANRAWWEVELASIVERDALTDAALAASGWLSLRVWEHGPPVADVHRIKAAVALRRPPRAPSPVAPHPPEG